jgi:hypothetical protein
MRNSGQITENLEPRTTKAASAAFVSDPEGTRTPNFQNRNLTFYPIELRDQPRKKRNTEKLNSK